VIKLAGGRIVSDMAVAARRMQAAG